MLKTFGYLISCLSVFLLGVAAWNGASKHPVTLAALILGMLASIIGMACRWWTYVREHREKLFVTGRKGPRFP